MPVIYIRLKGGTDIYCSSLAIQPGRLIALYTSSWIQEQESITKFRCGSGVFL